MSKNTKSITIMWEDIKVPFRVAFDRNPWSAGKIFDSPSCEDLTITEVYGGINQDIKCYKRLNLDAVTLVRKSLVNEVEAV